MRKLNFIVLGLTAMFAGAAFAQTPNMGGQGQTDQKAPAGTDRMNAGRYGDPMTSPVNSGKDQDKAKGGYHPQGRSAKRDPAQESPSQPRMGKKPESRESGE